MREVGPVAVVVMVWVTWETGAFLERFHEVLNLAGPTTQTAIWRRYSDSRVVHSRDNRIQYHVYWTENLLFSVPLSPI